jgi:hypothetical protein
VINSIESSIIAYFDNRLSDAERVELLREVNESEDARRLFRQHEVLRSLVQRAQARTVVDADTENLLLSKISPKTVGRSFVSRPRIFQAIPGAKTFSGVLAGAALILFGTYFLAPILGVNNEKNQFGGQQFSSRPLQSANDRSGNRIAIPQPEIEAGSKKHGSFAQTARLDARTLPTASLSDAPASSGASLSESASLADATFPTASTLGTAPLMECKMPDQRTANISDGRGSMSEIHALPSIEEATSERVNSFRLSLQADSPPINDRHFGGISGTTASLGYFISPSDIISARFGYYASRLFPPISESQSPLTSGKNDDHFVNIISAGLSIEHQVMAYDGRLIISGALGAGLQSHGNYVELNLSAVTPIGGNILTGIGVLVSHENLSTSAWTVQDPASPTGSSQWANLEGKHFATAKIYYMVSYAF